MVHWKYRIRSSNLRIIGELKEINKTIEKAILSGYCKWLTQYAFLLVWEPWRRKLHAKNSRAEKQREPGWLMGIVIDTIMDTRLELCITMLLGTLKKTNSIWLCYVSSVFLTCSLICKWCWYPILSNLGCCRL
jgi:hypothetical protein